jgi:hypothetical protein
VTRWLAALRNAVSTLASTSPLPAIGVLLIWLPVLTLNHYMSLDLSRTRPGDETPWVLVVPFAAAPLAGAILAWLHGLLPEYKWGAAFGLFLLTTVLIGPFLFFYTLVPFLGIPSLAGGGIGYLGGVGTRGLREPWRWRVSLVLLAIALLTYVHMLADAFFPFGQGVA